MSIHTITERAMVMTLSVGAWMGHRLDKAASQKITAEAGAASDAARVNKLLVPKESIAPVTTAQGTIRTHFYENTLPWRDNGGRLMTRLVYLDFIPRHEELVGNFHAAVEKFVTEDYPVAIEQAAFRMGELFKPDDYPLASELRRRFHVTLDIEAVTTANDFRVQMDQEHVDKVRIAMESTIERRINTAMQDVWGRLADVVGKFHERMDTPDAVFRDSLIENMAELVELIPGLNVLDDPNIEGIRQDIAKRIAGVDPKDVRKDPEFRQELAGEAQEILDRMAGFMAAFGGGQE